MGSSITDGSDAEMAAHIQDLRDVIGPNAETYLRKYNQISPAMVHRLQSGTGRQRRQARREISKKLRGWNWAAFLVPSCWFFYRKMYLMGAMVIALPVLGGVIFPTSTAAPTLGLMIVLGMQAYDLYHKSILAKVAKADEQSLIGVARREYLQQAGGVSVAGAMLGSLVIIAGLAGSILYVLSRAAS